MIPHAAPPGPRVQLLASDPEGTKKLGGAASAVAPHGVTNLDDAAVRTLHARAYQLILGTSRGITEAGIDRVVGDKN